MTLPKLEQKRPYLMHRHHALSKTLNTVSEHEGWIESLGDVGPALKVWRAAIIEELGGEVSAMELSVIELATKTHLLLASVDRVFAGMRPELYSGRPQPRTNARTPVGCGPQISDGTDGSGHVRAECDGPGKTAERGGSMYGCLSKRVAGPPQETMQNEQQRIMVQYVNVNHPSQAVIGNIEKDNGRELEPQPAMPMR
jgi:hypothetical protein